MIGFDLVATFTDKFFTVILSVNIHTKKHKLGDKGAKQHQIFDNHRKSILSRYHITHNIDRIFNPFFALLGDLFFRESVRINIIIENIT